MATMNNTVAFFTLEERRVIPCKNANGWFSWYRNEDKSNLLVGYNDAGYYRIETLFIGISTNNEAPPLVFETQIFKKETTKREGILSLKDMPVKDVMDILEQGYQAHIKSEVVEVANYATWKEAWEGHLSMIEKYRAIWLKEIRG